MHPTSSTVFDLNKHLELDNAHHLDYMYVHENLWTLTGGVSLTPTLQLNTGRTYRLDTLLTNYCMYYIHIHLASNQYTPFQIWTRKHNK